MDDDEIFDFDAASSRFSSHNPDEDAELSDVSSNNEDGLFGNNTSTLDENSGDEEAIGEEEDTAGDEVYSWKIDHSRGDHKLRRKLEPAEQKLYNTNSLEPSSLFNE